MNLEKAKQKLVQYQQAHLLRYYDELNDAFTIFNEKHRN